MASLGNGNGSNAGNSNDNGDSSGNGNGNGSGSGSGSNNPIRSRIGSFIKNRVFKKPNEDNGGTTLGQPGATSSRSPSALSVNVPAAAAAPRSPVMDSCPVDGVGDVHLTPTSPTVRNRRSRSPLANPSPATRRPIAANDPPPPYQAVAPASPVGASVGASSAVGAAGAAGAADAAAGASSGPRRPASLAPSTQSNFSRLTVNDVTSAEDPYAFLSSFDTIFVIDDSGSMAGRSWREVGAVLANITPICTSHDADGIDLYFLNHKRASTAAPPPGKATGGYANVRDVATVNRIFATVRPGGSTPTGTRIHTIIRRYLRHYEEKLRENPDEPEVKPVNMIVITDGEPSDDLEGVLHSAAKKLDQLDAPPFQVGIQFFKVGNEPGASEYLRNLDDHLSELVRGQGVRDMVDTVTWDAYVQRPGAGHAGLTADGILKAVLGAVVKRLDRLPTGPPRSPSPARRPLNI